MTEPIFAWTDDTDLTTAVGEALGAASACWSNLEGAGVFQSERASKLVDELVGFIHRWVGDTPGPTVRVTPLHGGFAPLEAPFAGGVLAGDVNLRLCDHDGGVDTHEHTEGNLTVHHNHEHGRLEHTHPDLSMLPPS